MFWVLIRWESHWSTHGTKMNVSNLKHFETEEAGICFFINPKSYIPGSLFVINYSYSGKEKEKKKMRTLACWLLVMYW